MIKLDKEIKKYNDLKDKMEKEKKKKKRCKRIIVWKNFWKINELKNKLSKYPLELNDGEKLMTVIFQSSNEEINFAAICKSADKFNKNENQLYEYYPEYGEKENSFTFNGKKLSRYKSMKESNINNNDIIIFNVLDK